MPSVENSSAKREAWINSITYLKLAIEGLKASGLPSTADQITAIMKAVALASQWVVPPPKADLTNLSVLSYAQSFTHWLYHGEPGDVVQPDFFPASETMFSDGDLMTVRGMVRTVIVEVRFTQEGTVTIRGLQP